MKLRPEKVALTSCVRCNAPFTEAGGQVRALCSPCDYKLQDMHWRAEYALYGKTYYHISPEGTSMIWLKENGYVRDVCASPVHPVRRGTKDAPLPIPPQHAWSIDEAFARTMRAGRQLYANYHRNEDVKAQAKAARLAGGAKHGPTWAEREGYPTLRYQPPRQRMDQARRPEGP